MTLLSKRVFADDRVKMRSLGWILTQYGCVLMKRGNLDTETQREVHAKRKTEVRVMQQKPRIASRAPEARGEAWSRSSSLMASEEPTLPTP